MEVLDGWKRNSLCTKHLLKAVRCARDADADGAYAAATLYFDELLPKFGDSALLDASTTMNRCVKFGLIFVARLERQFGHFDKANHLLAEAIRQAQGTHDFVCLKLAMLERGSLEICTSRFAMLGRFVRNEPWLRNDAQYAGNFPEKSQDQLFLNVEKLGQLYTEEELDPNAKMFYKQLIYCDYYLNAVTLAIRCESIERAFGLLKQCLGMDLGVDRLRHARMVRMAAETAISTIQLSQCFVVPSAICSFVLDEMADGDAGEEERGGSSNTEAMSIMFVNAAYSLALDGKFVKASEIINRAKLRFPEENNPVTAFHWNLALACIDFDAKLFGGSDMDTEVETLTAYSPTEADFRTALLFANSGEYIKALKILESRFNILHSGSDTILSIRCLMCLGTIYCEGAIKSGIKTLEDALSIAISHKLSLFVAMIRRRLVYAYLIDDRGFEEIHNLLDKCAPVMENVRSPRLERGMYYITKFKLFAREELRQKQSSESQALKYLLQALETFVEHYPQLEKNVYEEAHIFCEQFEGSKGSEYKKLYEQKLLELPSALNWFLL